MKAVIYTINRTNKLFDEKKLQINRLFGNLEQNFQENQCREGKDHCYPYTISVRTGKTISDRDLNGH